ncbi:MAG: tetratricopeptide repeat protein [Georgfuchsia sp.]
MKLKHLLIAALIAPLSPFATAAETVPAPVVAQPEAVQEEASALTPKILYQILLAEIAIGRGQLPVAAAAYADLAESTRDPRIARRASEVAYYARQPQLSLDAARIWSETDPDSVQARQAYWTLLGNMGKSEQLTAALAGVVASETADKRGEVLIQLSHLLSRQTDKKMAMRIADEITKPYLTLPEAHFVRAQSAYGAEDKARASSELDQALALKPDWEQAAILRAQFFAANPEAAIDSLADFVKKYPKAFDARLAYGRALIEGKRYDAARAEFAVLLEEEPDRPDLLFSVGLLSLQLGEVDKAEDTLKSLLDKDFPEMDSVHFYLGQIAEDAGRVQEAIGHYDSIAPGSQHHIQGQVCAAAALARTGQLQQAIDRLHAAQAANPEERINLLAMEAQFLADSGNPAAAYQLLADALQKSPDDTVLLYESALLAERLDKMDVLERNLRQVIKLKPDYAHAYNALGYSLADRNQRIDEASTLIDKAFSLAPDDPAILDSMGWVNFRRGDLPAAAKMLQKALTLLPDPEIAAHLGEVQWQMGHQDEANKTWDDGLKLAPDNEVLNSTIKRLRH